LFWIPAHGQEATPQAPAPQQKTRGYSHLLLQLPALMTLDTFDGNGNVGAGLNLSYSYQFQISDKNYIGPMIQVNYNYYGTYHFEGNSLDYSSLSFLVGLEMVYGEDTAFFTSFCVGRNTSYFSFGGESITHSTMGFKFDTGMLFSLSRIFRLGFDIGYHSLGSGDESTVLFAGLSAAFKF